MKDNKEDIFNKMVVEKFYFMISILENYDFIVTDIKEI